MKPRPFALSDRPLHRDNPATRRAIIQARPEPEPESPGEAVKAFLVFALLIVSLYLLVIVAAGYAASVVAS